MQHSYFFEADVLEEPERALVPKLDPYMLWDSSQLCSHNVCETLQVLLPSRNPFLVQLAQFKEAEQSFDRRSGVGVRRRVHDRDLHLVEVVPDLLAGVVGSIIDEDNGILLPARFLQVQLPDQSPHKQHKSVLISVRMTEGEVNMAV